MCITIFFVFLSFRIDTPYITQHISNMHKIITTALLFFVVLLSGCLSSREAQNKYGLVMSEEEARAKAESDEAAARMEEEETGRRSKKHQQQANEERQQSSISNPLIAEEQFDNAAPADTLDLAIINYVVRGRVIGENGKPVQGIQVIILNNTVDATPENLNLSDESIREYVEAASDTTAVDGRFKVMAQDYEAPYMRLFIRDIDGPSHGNYINEVVNIYFDESDRKSYGHGWRHDALEKRVTLKPKVRR